MLLGALAALPAAAQNNPARPLPKLEVLPSKTYPFDQLPTTGSDGHKGHTVMHGTTHGGFSVQVHITELGAGLEPHPPHRHVHEEIIMLKEGTCDVTVEGKTTRIGPGGVAYNASNELHGLKNVGTTTAVYFVVELRGDEPRA